MTMRAVVAEDEHLALRRLTRLLRESGVEVVGEARSGHAAVRMLREVPADVAFLDVEMPGLDGLGVVREVEPETLPRVVFVTAHEGYALEAFRVHAVDYLLKPFDKSRLASTLEHLRELDDGGGCRDRQTASVAEPGGDPWSSKRYAERLLVREDTSLHFVPVKHIEAIEADGNYVHLHAEGGSHLVRRRIGELEEQLDPERFMRIHRSAIVNLHEVDHLVPWFSGGYLLRLRSGRELKLSRGYATKLFERVGTSW